MRKMMVMGVVSVLCSVACAKEGPGARSAPDVVGITEVQDSVEAALREKVLALAVASECMRKTGVPQAQATHAMLSLYKAHGIALERYAKLMTKLSAEPAFTAEVERLTQDCPALPAEPKGLADVQVAPDTNAPDTTSPDTAPADTAPADTRSPLADAGPSEDAPRAVTDAQTPTERDLSGTWTGPAAGPVAGTLRVTIAGRTIKEAVATFGRTTYRLKGSLSDRDAIMLAGKEGMDFLRLTGKLEANHKSFSGAWNGVINRKRAEGRFRIVR
jgi:hypothetical protein